MCRSSAPAPCHTYARFTLLLLLLTLLLCGMPQMASAQQQGPHVERHEQRALSQRFVLLPSVGLRFVSSSSAVDPLFEEALAISALGGVALYSTETRGPYAAALLEYQSFEVFDGRKARFMMPVLRLGWSWAPSLEKENFSNTLKGFFRFNLYAMGGYRSASLSMPARMRAGVGMHFPALSIVGGFGNLEVSSEWGGARPATLFFSWGWSL